jgi:hypothetical protein
MHPREAAELHESGGTARNLLEPLLDTLQGRPHHLPVAEIITDSAVSTETV